MSVDRRTAPLLVLGGVVSVQFGGAFAATLVPRIGAPGSVLLRLLFAMVILYAVARPSWRGRSRSDWGTVVLFGLALAAMNTSFYASLAHLPIGVAVTIEFLGPITVATVLSRTGDAKWTDVLIKLVQDKSVDVGREGRQHAHHRSFLVQAIDRAAAQCLVGVSEEPCKRGRKDKPCLQELIAGSVKKKMLLSARSEATPAP